MESWSRSIFRGREEKEVTWSCPDILKMCCTSECTRMITGSEGEMFPEDSLCHTAVMIAAVRISLLKQSTDVMQHYVRWLIAGEDGN